MKKKIVNKSYVYLRDNKSCFYCEKSLKLGKMTLDHYYPKSHGGTMDLFNLVSSCKKCNYYKGSLVPKDHIAVRIRLFKQAVKDRKIFTIGGLDVKHQDLSNMIDAIDRMSESGRYTVFESPDYRFYVYDNKIFKIVRVDRHGDEWEVD